MSKEKKIKIKPDANELDKKVIEDTAKATAKEVISELKKQGLIKDNKQTAFQKTETLLYNYNNFMATIEDKYTQIRMIMDEGLSRRSNSVSSFSKQPSYDFKNDSEKAEDKIEMLQQSIKNTQGYIDIIDAAIIKIKDDQYYEIITMKYFENKTREEIAEYFEKDASTISRNKNRLVKTLSIKLFSDDVLQELFVS